MHIWKCCIRIKAVGPPSLFSGESKVLLWLEIIMILNILLKKKVGLPRKEWEWEVRSKNKIKMG